MNRGRGQSTRVRTTFGGEMELASVVDDRGAKQPSFGTDTTLVASGRTALFLIARAAVSTGRSGPALVPSYACASIGRALGEAGLAVRRYKVDAKLQPDLQSLEAAVDRHSPAFVLLIHYFGFPVPAPVFDRLARFRGRCWIVEDCCHGSWLEGPGAAAGRCGDFVFTSFRKYLPVPDGGVLLNRARVTLPQLAAEDSPFVRWRLAAKLLRHAFLEGAVSADAEMVYLDLFAAAERRIDEHVPTAGMSLVSQGMLDSCDLPAVRDRRRRNFLHALARVSQQPIMRVAAPLFTELPDGVSPLVMPLFVAGRRRDRLRAALAKRRVFCPVHWPLERQAQGAAFGDARRSSRAMLGLPIDQRYGPSEIDTMMRRVESACREVLAG